MMRRDKRGAFAGAQTLLVVDPESALRERLRRAYERAGWQFLGAADGLDGLRLIYRRHPDAVVLGAGPPADGWTTLARIREVSEVPVIMLGASGSEAVRALRSGADDFVTKPVGTDELLARTEALVRRTSRAGRPPPVEHYDDGMVAVNFATRLVRVGGCEVALTPQEYRVLSAFVQHPDHVLSTEQLLSLAWQSDIGTRDQVKVYVGYVRRKLGAAGDRIETVRGFGYRYRPARSVRL